ncbi:hypothetical protein O181_055979, partial [Austropuccinia psidii MF-1]|nr:hypothetical protein [Austropuccinia psidii MF-1]
NGFFGGCSFIRDLFSLFGRFFWWLFFHSKLMPKNLGVQQRSQIVGMWQAGLSVRTIALRMGVPKSTVHDTIRRFREHGTCADRPKTGRPPLLNQADRHNLDEFITHNQRANLNEISQAIPNNVSNRTISKAIHDLGKRSCIAHKKPYLRELDFNRRLTFAQQLIRSGFGEHLKKSTYCKIFKLTIVRANDHSCIQTTLATILQLHGQCTLYLDSRTHCDDGRWRPNSHCPNIKRMASHQSDRQAALASPLPRPQSNRKCLESFENLGNETSPAPHNGQITCAIQSAWDDLSPAFFEKLLIGMQKRLEAVVESHGGPTQCICTNTSYM